jgi:hypothetical protein
MADACRMRNGLRALVAATVGAWLFYLLYLGAVLMNLGRLGWSADGDLPALAIATAGVIASALIGFAPSQKLSTGAKVALELLLLLVGLVILISVMSFRAG